MPSQSPAYLLLCQGHFFLWVLLMSSLLYLAHYIILCLPASPIGHPLRAEIILHFSILSIWYIKVQFSLSVVSNSLWPHGLQHARLPCPSPTPGACSNSCPLSWWCYPTISSSVVLLFLPSIFPSIRVFSKESALHIRWPKYWSFSFSISPSSVR